MLTTAEIFQKLDEKRLELGLSQAEVGRRALRHTDGSALQNIKRGSSPSVDTLAKLCDALGLELYVGPPRVDAKPIRDFQEGQAETDFGDVSPFRSGYVPLPWIDHAAGRGQPPITFSLTWLDRHGLIPDNLACITPDKVNLQDFGDPKAIAVIDKNSRRHGYGIWAFSEGSTSVARALIEDEIVVIQGADAFTTPRVIRQNSTGGPTILGRVVWIGLFTNLKGIEPFPLDDS